VLLVIARQAVQRAHTRIADVIGWVRFERSCSHVDLAANSRVEEAMRVLIIGAGGVGSAMVRTAIKWNLFEHVVVADYDESRAQRAIVGGGDRFAAFQLDGSNEQAIVELIKSER
jgi:shikimate 5-dehydrogenase